MSKLERNTSEVTRKREPASTPEGRENQLIALAVDLAEEQLRNKTASAQVITHYLKLGSTKERLEKEILEKQKDLIVAKAEALKSSKHMEEVYNEALAAMKSYSGFDDGDNYDTNV